MRRLFSLVILALVACGYIASQQETLALVGGTLINGTGAEPVHNAVVVVQNGRIVAVGMRKNVVIPEDARTIDVAGKTILPGFINAHVHFPFTEVEQHLKAWAQGGVTTVRNIGSRPFFSERDSVLEDNQNARLVMSGPLVTVPDGYPIIPWGNNIIALTVTSSEDARQKVDKLLDDGADIIKIAIERGDVLPSSVPNTLSLEEAAAIVEVAHSRDTIVSAHVTASRDLKLALDAGVDDIAHMVADTLPPELIERMIKDGVYWVPTLELWKCVAHGYRQPAIDNLALFVKAGGGGKVALGTDFNGYNCRFQLGMPTTEMGLMQAAGMTPMQIIVAGTRNAAHVSNLARELGTLEAGKIADIIVVEGDPLSDIHALANVKMVIHNGVVIKDEMKGETKK
ncbi:MAG: amidohydrolase family protein [Spirochaetota bacterium]